MSRRPLARPLALIVEDSEDQLELLGRYLTKEGFDIRSASTAEAAFAAFDEIEPSLAVIDLMLPGIPGDECARRVRERFPDCHVVISSVLDVIDYPIADAVLPKPVRGAQVHELVMKLRG